MAEEDLKDANASGADVAEQPIPTMPEGGNRAAGQDGAKQSARGSESELEAKYAELEGQFKRLAADFDNFRRRATSEREELIKFASSRVLENILPVVDNFERALGAMGKATEVAQVQSGIEMIYRQMQDFLSKSGVAAMEAVGKPFDPNLHEAIAQTENLDHPDETVLAEVQKGYLLNGKVLRHAMVQVSRNPSGTVPTPADSGAAPSSGDNAEAVNTTSQTSAGESAANKEDHNG